MWSKTSASTVVFAGDTIVYGLYADLSMQCLLRYRIAEGSLLAWALCSGKGWLCRLALAFKIVIGRICRPHQADCSVPTKTGLIPARCPFCWPFGSVFSSLLNPPRPRLLHLHASAINSLPALIYKHFPSHDFLLTISFTRFSEHASLNNLFHPCRPQPVGRRLMQSPQPPNQLRYSTRPSASRSARLLLSNPSALGNQYRKSFHTEPAQEPRDWKSTG